MSAATAVLSGPNSLSNNSPRTCANTCGQASLAAANNSSSIASGCTSGDCILRSSTHSPYGSSLSLESIGFISCRSELRSTETSNWVVPCANITRDSYPCLEILSYFFTPRCSLVSEERFYLGRVRHTKFQVLGANLELDTPLPSGEFFIATRSLLHVDHLRPVPPKMRDAEDPQGRLLPRMLSHCPGFACHRRRLATRGALPKSH